MENEKEWGLRMRCLDYLGLVVKAGEPIPESWICKKCREVPCECGEQSFNVKFDQLFIITVVWVIFWTLYLRGV
jgi:hypothetical protein